MTDALISLSVYESEALVGRQIHRPTSHLHVAAFSHAGVIWAAEEIIGRPGNFDLPETTCVSFQRNLWSEVEKKKKNEILEFKNSG